MKSGQENNIGIRQMPPAWSQMPLDLLVILLLVPAHTQLEGIPFLLGLSLLLYVGLEFWRPLSAYADLPDSLDKTRLAFLARLALLFLMVMASCVIPASRNILIRAHSPLDDNGYTDAYGLMHDGALQIEAALEYISQGKNPYVERYDDTPLRFFALSGIEIGTNPAFNHLAYLPGLLVTSYPFYFLSSAVGLFFDQRFIYLTAYILLVLLLPLLVNAPSHKLLVVATVALNPLLVGPVILGMNDVIVILAVVVSIILLIRQHYLLSTLALGIACVLKQSAWFLVPFYLLLLYGLAPERERVKKVVSMAIIIAMVAVIVIGPFVVWDPAAFWTDVIAYPAGRVTVNYPIRGYTIGNLLVGANIIASPLDYFPFWLPQLLVGIPLLLILMRYQSRRNDLGIMLLCAGTLTLGLGFVSRFFQDNYLGYVTVLMSLGILLIRLPGKVAPTVEYERLTERD